MDVSTQPAPAAANAEAVQNSSAPDAAKSEIESLKSLYADLSKKFESVNFAKLRLEAKAAKSAQPDEEKETVSLASLKRELEEERKARQTEKEQSRAFKAKQAYIAELSKAKVNPVHAKLLANDFVAKYATKIRLGEDDEVHIAEDESTIKPLISVVESFLKSDEGAAWLPPKATANSDALNKSSSGNNTLGGWLPKTLKEAMDEPNKYAQLKRENPAYVASLK